MSKWGSTQKRALVASSALAMIVLAAPGLAADGGVGGLGDGGTGGNGGGSSFPGTAGTGGQGGPGAPGTAVGQNGGAGGTPTSPGFAGGGGGGAASGDAINSLGGNGGRGGNATAGAPGTGYGGGGGGGGGNGVDIANFSTNDTASLGGRGGDGGNAAGSPFGAGNGGGGGVGGYGLLVSNSVLLNNPGVTIAGGNGGTGGNGSGLQFSGSSIRGDGGAGGQGGQGIVADNATLANRGFISGGAGGAGGTAGTTGLAGSIGLGGVGVTGANLTVINSGQIFGGPSADGSVRANAITFTGGVNSLTLQSGYEIVGNVQAASRADRLVLSGTSPSSFNLANLGDTAQYRGFGILQKDDISTWAVFGTSNFAGTFDIRNGTVELSALANGANTIVRSGASLTGNGGIGSLDAQSGSTISPGRGTNSGDNASFGRLAVNGNLVFRQGSTYQVNVNTGASDVIQATGSATIEGGRVQVLAAQVAGYGRVSEYSILRAAIVTGQFSELTSDLAFVTPSLTYGPDRVNLVLTRNDVPLRAVATTPNQAQVAAALQSLSATDPVLAAVLLQNPDAARAALELLSGEVGPSSISSTFNILTIAAAVMTSGGFGGFGDLSTSGPSLFGGRTVNADYAADAPNKPLGGTRMPIGNLDPKTFSMWGSAFGSFGSTASNGNAGALTRDVGGFVVGADATFDQMYRIGLAAGYTRSSFDVRSRASSGETDTGFGAIYGGVRLGAVTLRLGGLFAGMSSDTRRSIVFPGFADNVTGRFGGTGLLGFGEVGYRFDVGTSAIEPFVGGSGMRLSRDAYTERGGPAALIFAQRDYDIQTLTAGVRGSMAISADLPVTIRGQLAYRRAFGDVVPTALLAFAGGGTQFQTAGIPIDVNALVAEAGIGYQATKDLALELAYTGQVGRRAEDHGVKGSFLWKF